MSRGPFRSGFFALLWTPGPARLEIPLAEGADAAAQRLADSVASAEGFVGRVAGRGVKLECHPQAAHSRGTFAPVFYGVFQPGAEGSRLVGHFQLHPVARLYAAVWIGLSTLLALALLVAGALRATPESTAQEALPFVLIALLPFVGLGIVRWQSRRGRVDQQAIRAWLEEWAAGG